MRVLDAAQPPVEAHPADALLVARQAQPDLLAGPGPCLGREVGVGDLPAHDADEVAVALGEGPLGLQRVFEPADADDWQLDRLADGRRDEQRVAGRHVHRRLDHEQRRRCHADRGVDVIDLAARLHHPGDGDRLVDRRAALDQLVAAEADPQRQPVADHPPHRRDELQQQPGPVLERAAVAVGTPVGGGGEEPAHDRRVAALQLDAVEATLGAVLGDGGVAGDDLVDLGGGHRLGHLPEQRVGHRRRGPDRQPGVHRRRLSPVVVDLGEDRHPVPVDGLGDAEVPGDHVAVEAVDQLLVRPVGGMGRVLLGDDEAGAAGGAGGVVGGVLLGRPAVTGVVREVGREDDPVANRHRAELERCPQVPVGHGVRGYDAVSAGSCAAVTSPRSTRYSRRYGRSNSTRP